MSQNVPDIETIYPIMYICNQSVFVPPDIENRKVFDLIRTREQIFYILKSSEIHFFYYEIPPVQTFVGFRVFITKIPNFFPAYDMHRLWFPFLLFPNH